MARDKGKKGGAGKGGARARREESSSEEEEEEERAPRDKKSVGAQPATAGQLPPSDSEGSDSDSPPAAAAPKRSGGQPSNAGKLPPSDDDDSEGESSEEESDDEDDGKAARPAGARAPHAAPVEKTPAELAADLAKLELVRKRRAEQAAQRIAQEGFDRFAARAS